LVDELREARRCRVPHRASLASTRLARHRLVSVPPRATLAAPMRARSEPPAMPLRRPAWYRRLPLGLQRIAAASDRVPTVPLPAGQRPPARRDHRVDAHREARAGRRVQDVPPHAPPRDLPPPRLRAPPPARFPPHAGLLPARVQPFLRARRQRDRGPALTAPA